MAGLDDDELIERSVALAAELIETARRRTTRRERRRQARLRRLLAEESGTRLVFALADRVLRPRSAAAAATELAAVAAGDLAALSGPDRVALRLAGRVARLAPVPVVGAVGARLRHETTRLVYRAEPAALGRRLRRLRAAGRRPNVNLLGEAVLGHGEAARRTQAVAALLRRGDVDCVSVKVSSVAAGLSLVDFDGSLRRIAGPLRRLYREAAASGGLVMLDMEEHVDLDLTVESFRRVLDEEEFASVRAGIAVQAYLPDTHGAVDRLLAWAARRRRAGATAVRIRLVKGANLAMETVTAELRGWPSPAYATKADTDASYVGLLERLVEAAASGSVEVGVASHNLFDVALAVVLSEAAGVAVDVEMLAGMADGQAAAVAERAGGLLLYVPATTRRDFRNALAYLARRLDENTAPEGFLHHVFEMAPGSAAWDDQAARFAASVRARHGVATAAFQTQDRRRPPPSRRAAGTGFVNEPDTDLSVAAQRDWAVAAVGAGAPPTSVPADEAAVEQAVARATTAGELWGRCPVGERREVLEAVAEAMAAGRAESVAVMAAEAGKTFAEADTEVSEGIDYARYYAGATALLGELDGELVSEPCGVVVVAPPWNFPYAIAAGGVLAALAAGNTALLKPSPQTLSTGAVVVEQLRRGGLDDDRLQLVAAADGVVGERLVGHGGVGAVILTGSWETAVLFGRLAPGRRLLAETNGKNAMVVTATADVDQAVRDLVRSAFGHAGQKCSAASVAIVDASVYDDPAFLRQLADATTALRVGAGTDPATEVGPLVGPVTAALERALTVLDPGESWLVAPRRLDTEGRRWSPGVRIGVRPGSWAHTTEWFGPVLAVMRAQNLDQALDWQSAVAYGLTAGLQSLDPAEHRRFVDRAEAGNLYINRPTTGAVVGRQPFGGWKRSSLGPTAKTGGPNYLLGLRRWRDGGPVTVEAAAADYRRWWARHFATVTELAGLRGESNQLRYRPLAPGVVVRVGEGGTDEEVAKAEAAAAVTGTTVVVSSRPGGGGRWRQESAAAVAAGLRAAAAEGRSLPRLRLLGQAEEEVLLAAAACGVTVCDEPVCGHGRVELVRWLREQVVTRSLHRYGNVVYPPLELR